MKTHTRAFLTVFGLLLAVVMCPVGIAHALEAGEATGAMLSTQSSYNGLYECQVGDISKWGGTKPVKKPGYILDVEVVKKKGKTLVFKVQQTFFYGAVGSYIANTKKKVTVKLKGGKAKFTFRSFCGDKGNGKIVLVSKNKLKISLKTTSPGKERIPFSTGGKLKTLKRAKLQYHLS